MNMTLTNKPPQPLSSPSVSRPQYEVADIFRNYGEEFRATHVLTSKQKAVMRAIEICRSSDLGYHVDCCDSCGHTEISYNSCRDRHCPKCQGIQKNKWVEARLNDLLPVPYYHVVFTIPNDIFPVCLFNQKVIYKLLFETASETLLTFGRDDKWLGAQTGFFGILHTWGQTMCMHPHIHFIVPGGGIDENDQWVPAKHGDKFLFPVRAMSKVFRAKFIYGLKQSYENNQLSFPGELEKFRHQEGFMAWIDALCSNQWIVYAKPPFADAQQVVKYLGRYTHRVAISNQRIRSIDNGHVVFTYKDYADNHKIKELTLTAHEFIGRFLWHVLPSGFHKIRHYGFMANGMKKKLEKILQYLKSNRQSTVEPVEQGAAVDNRRMLCPVCQHGRLYPIAIITRYGIVVVKDVASFIKYLQKETLDRPPKSSLSFA